MIPRLSHFSRSIFAPQFTNSLVDRTPVVNFPIQLPRLAEPVRLFNAQNHRDVFPRHPHSRNCQTLGVSPAEPEDFLWINGISSLHLRDAAVKTSALTAAKKWDGSQDAFPIMFILSNCARRLASAVTFADLGLTPARLGTTSQL
jgi:hypothetical protein